LAGFEVKDPPEERKHIATEKGGFVISNVTTIAHHLRLAASYQDIL
jgi:hypothetical protein